MLGKHSGRHALGLKCQQLGYEFSRRELDRIYKHFVALADQIKVVEDRHLLAIIREEMPAVAAIKEMAEVAQRAQPVGHGVKQQSAFSSQHSAKTAES